MALALERFNALSNLTSSWREKSLGCSDWWVCRSILHVTIFSFYPLFLPFLTLVTIQCHFRKKRWLQP